MITALARRQAVRRVGVIRLGLGARKFCFDSSFMFCVFDRCIGLGHRILLPLRQVDPTDPT